MSGHTMKVTYDPLWQSVRLSVECHEPSGATCRDTSSGECEATDWFVDDVELQCDSEKEFPLRDGMAITVHRKAEGWTWNGVSPK